MVDEAEGIESDHKLMSEFHMAVVWMKMIVEH